MVDPNKPTATQEQSKEVKDLRILQELQELLDDKEEYRP